MKIYGNLLSLCAFHPNVWGATAFLAHAPKALLPKGGQTTNVPSLSSYLDNLDVVGGEKAESKSTSTPAPAWASDAAPSAPVDDSRLKALEEALEARLAGLEQAQQALQQVQSSAPKGTPDHNASPNSNRATDGALPKNSKQAWDTKSEVTVQGGSLRTWSFANPAIERVQVLLKTDGRPLDADIELWQGPDNTPEKMKVYIEDGGLRTFSVVMCTPRAPNTIAVRNTGHLEFPMAAIVGPDKENDVAAIAAATAETIQGGALKTFAFEPNVESVAVYVKTDGRPLNARIELLQGPNNIKQLVELYTENGMDRPFIAVVETPGSGNVVRIKNEAPVEFPMIGTAEPYHVSNADSWSEDAITLGNW